MQPDIFCSWDDLRSSGEAELMNSEPNLSVCIQRVEVCLAIVTECIEVIEERGAAVAIAELKIVADAGGFGNVVSVIARGHRGRCFVADPRLIYVIDDLIACGGFGEAAGLCLVTSALFLTLSA